MSDGLKVSVLVPVYNELHTVERVIERVRSIDVQTQIILVDDCSQDGTRDLLRKMAERDEEDLTILFHETNRGKGAAIRTALAAAVQGNTRPRAAEWSSRFAAPAEAAGAGSLRRKQSSLACLGLPPLIAP